MFPISNFSIKTPLRESVCLCRNRWKIRTLKVNFINANNADCEFYTRYEISTFFSVKWSIEKQNLRKYLCVYRNKYTSKVL